MYIHRCIGMCMCVHESSVCIYGRMCMCMYICMCSVCMRDHASEVHAHIYTRHENRHAYINTCASCVYASCVCMYVFMYVCDYTYKVRHYRCRYCLIWYRNYGETTIKISISEFGENFATIKKTKQNICACLCVCVYVCLYVCMYEHAGTHMACTHALSKALNSFIV